LLLHLLLMLLLLPPGTTRTAPSISSVLPSPPSPPYLSPLGGSSPTALSILLGLLSVVSFYD